MSQATLETAAMEAQPAEVAPGEAALASNTDQLLNKMAGTEVDRLLAETEADRSASAALATAAPAAENSAVAEEDTALAAQLDDLLIGLEEPAAAPAAVSEEIQAEPPAVSKVEPPAVSLVELPAASKVEPPDPAATEDARLEVLAAELEVDAPSATPAVSKVEPPAVPSPAPALIAQRLPTTDVKPVIPLLLRPLIWINAPLSGLSSALRSAFGTVAVVNFLAAAAVLIYAIVSRKPH